MKASMKFSPEVQERAVRMVAEAQGQHDSQWAAIVSIAAKIDCTAETRHPWVRQAQPRQRATRGADDGRGAAHPGAGTRGARAA